VKDWNVGSIPRGLETIQKGPNQYLAVFCWGSSTVEIYLPAVGNGLVATLSLGRDPTRADVKAGRTLYYSASHSQHNNLSCNTCHIDGFADLLAWDLSDRRKDAAGAHTIPVDDKGPLVTQTLRTLVGQLPYHWRGERADLIDFNGAFEGLLGGTKLNEAAGGDFAKFQATRSRAARTTTPSATKPMPWKQRAATSRSRRSCRHGASSSRRACRSSTRAARPTPCPCWACRSPRPDWETTSRTS
jgi:hypothetical protein